MDSDRTIQDQRNPVEQTYTLTFLQEIAREKKDMIQNALRNKSTVFLVACRVEMK